MARVPARILGTGVELSLDEETDDPGPPMPLPMTPERRAEEARIAAGEMVAVRVQSFVEFEAEGVTHRWAGASYGRAIDVTGDPTLALIDLAEEAREEAPFGDLRRADFDVTRWEYYSAPYRLEISPELRERLPDRL